MFDHSIPPTEDGRHPEHPHLVLAEIEHHHDSYIFTVHGHQGDALISVDDALHIFGEQFDQEFAYVTDEYLDILN